MIYIAPNPSPSDTELPDGSVNSINYNCNWKL